MTHAQALAARERLIQRRNAGERSHALKARISALAHLLLALEVSDA